MATSAFAQAPAHQLKLKNDPALKSGLVISSDGRTVQFQTQAGTIGFPLANVESISMPAPPEYAQAQQALAQRDTDKALQLSLAIVTKYKGLPTDWAKGSLSTAAYLSVGKDTPKAKAMYSELEQLYPGGGGLQAKIGKALIAIEDKDFLTAKDILAPVTEEALKAKTVPRDNAFAYSQAFYASGRVAENEGKLQDALENYLRTVTVFFNDPSSRAAAQERADALRARNKDKKTSEQLTAP